MQDGTKDLGKMRGKDYGGRYRSKLLGAVIVACMRSVSSAVNDRRDLCVLLAINPRDRAW